MAPRSDGPSVGVVVRITVTVLGVLLLAYAAYRVRSILILVFVAAFLGLEAVLHARTYVRNAGS
jgi:hypothetical protein